MVPGNRFMEGMPQPLNLVHPRGIYRLIQHDELRIFCQPALCFFALVDDVVIQDQRDAPGAPISPLSYTGP